MQLKTNNLKLELKAQSLELKRKENLEQIKKLYKELYEIREKLLDIKIV